MVHLRKKREPLHGVEHRDNILCAFHFSEVAHAQGAASLRHLAFVPPDSDARPGHQKPTHDIAIVVVGYLAICTHEKSLHAHVTPPVLFPQFRDTLCSLELD